MIKKISIFVAICLFCISCGVKSDPEYKSQENYNKNIYLV
jgi:hypothetical protein